MHPAEKSIDTRTDKTSTPPVRQDIVDTRADTHETVSHLVPSEVESHREKPYRDAGPGGWRVWH